MKLKILQNGTEINRIEATLAFAEEYCQKNNYSFEEIIEKTAELPTKEDTIEAQLAYTAMMTDTLIGG